MARPLQRALPAVGKRVPKEGPMAHQEDSDKEPRSASSTTPVDDCFVTQLAKAENMPKHNTLFMFVILQLPSNKCPK